MSPLWTSKTLAAATGGAAHGAWHEATGVAIDSREVRPGDLFVALEGPNHDGHRFVAAALAAGAAGAMVRSDAPDLPQDAPLLRVRDTLDGLTALGAAGRARSDARIVAVTGSVGKTGTKEALRRALATFDATHAGAASHNNHWGVPLSLARLPRGAAFGVFEVGMNHAGEVEALTRLVRPHVAVITAIGPVHLEAFPSIEAIADAKAEIFLGMAPGGVAVLNRDDRHFARLRRHAETAGRRVLTFGGSEGADVRLLTMSADAEGSDVTAEVSGVRLVFRVSLPGGHHVMNGLAVLAAVRAVGADPTRAAPELGRLEPLPGRGRRHRLPVPGGEALLIDDSYNANPTSVAAALAVLGARPGRRIAVLGDMLELGETATALHAGLAEPVEAHGVDLVFTVGARMRALQEALDPTRRGRHTATADDMAPLLGDALRPGDTVLIKGSLGTRMGRVVDRLLREAAARPAGGP